MKSARPVEGYIYNLIQKFDASCEHIRYMLIENAVQEFRANLMTGEITPQKLSIERNEVLIGYVRVFYKSRIDPILDGEICSAELRLRMGKNSSTTSVKIECHDGRAWSHEAATDNPLIQK